MVRWWIVQGCGLRSRNGKGWAKRVSTYQKWCREKLGGEAEKKMCKSWEMAVFMWTRII